MAEGYKIIHRRDFETTGNWSLARRSLGLASFGLNIVEIPPGEQIPEHDETERDQEEVFCVWDGEAVVVIDGEDHRVEAGTFVRLDPHLTRTVRNDGESPVTVLIASAPRSSGYEPMPWG